MKTEVQERVLFFRHLFVASNLLHGFYRFWLYGLISLLRLKGVKDLGLMAMDF
jgi:hypothetical protein